jgi:hypothetical protein
MLKIARCCAHLFDGHCLHDSLPGMPLHHAPDISSVLLTEVQVRLVSHHTCQSSRQNRCPCCHTSHEAPFPGPPPTSWWERDRCHVSICHLHVVSPYWSNVPLASIVPECCRYEAGPHTHSYTPTDHQPIQVLTSSSVSVHGCAVMCRKGKSLGRVQTVVAYLKPKAMPSFCTAVAATTRTVSKDVDNLFSSD